MKELMKEFQYLVNREAKKINKDEPIFEEKFFDLVNEIEDKLAYGEDWLTQTKKEGFTVNATEAEGYARALREVKETCVDLLREIEENKKVME